MKCLVCHEPQPGPHKMSCRPSERESAEMWAAAKRPDRAMLHVGSTPWGEKPTVGAMLARLDAFCARYAGDCGDRDKAANVRTPFNARMR
jgi:hypothetical protein